MKKYICVATALMVACATCDAQSKLAKELEKGKQQTLVVYGTSISSMGPNGTLWVKQVGEELNKKFDNRLTLYNSGKSGQNSVWALNNLKDSVLSKHPDAVIIEFATNDAVTRFSISPEQSRANTVQLIGEIKAAYPDCEIFLHTPCGYPLGKNRENRPQMDVYNRIYESLAGEKGLIWIDEAGELIRIAQQKGEKELRLYAGDGVHPTRKGALELICPTVLKAILGE